MPDNSTHTHTRAHTKLYQDMSHIALDSNIHCESKQGPLYFLHITLGRYWRIFAIHSVLNSSRNLQQCDCYTDKHTSYLMLHYLVKWQLSQTKQRHFHTETIHSTSVVTNKMSVYDKVQMQVTKTVRNVPLSHRHTHKIVNATGWLCHWWLSHTSIKHCFRSSTSHTFAQLTRSCIVPHTLVNRTEVGVVGKSQAGSSDSRNLSLQ